MRQTISTALITLLAVALLASPARAEDKSRASAPTRRTLTEAERKTARFHMDFDKVEIVEVVKYIAEWTGKNFILPSTVHGQITIIGPTEVTGDEAYAAFLSALRSTGFTVVPTGAFLKIVSLDSIR